MIRRWSSENEKIGIKYDDSMYNCCSSLCDGFSEWLDYPLGFTSDSRTIYVTHCIVNIQTIQATCRGRKEEVIGII